MRSSRSRSTTSCDVLIGHIATLCRLGRSAGCLQKVVAFRVAAISLGEGSYRTRHLPISTVGQPGLGRLLVRSTRVAPPAPAVPGDPAFQARAALGGSTRAGPADRGMRR